MAKGDKLKGALSREPRNRGTRVSPGVYRSPKGNLVRPRQQYMERRRQQQPNQPAPSGPPASLMGRIEAEGPTQQDFTGAVTNAMQYSPGQMGNAWGPNQGGRPMANAVQNMPDFIKNYGNEVVDGLGNRNFNPPSTNVPNWPPTGSRIDPNWNTGYGLSPYSFEANYRPSANQGGRYRLSPGVYGTEAQARQQFDREAEQWAMSKPYQLYAKNK